MPISATGNRPPRDAGYTLVEAMVVLLIVGLMAGAVVVLAPGPDRAARDAARQLAARLAYAREESVLVNKPIALVVSSEGYGFMRLEENGWLRLSRAGPLSFRAWPQGVAARVEQNGAQENDEGRVARFDPLGGATPARVALGGGGGEWRVTIDGSGDLDVARAR